MSNNTKKNPKYNHYNNKHNRNYCCHIRIIKLINMEKRGILIVLFAIILFSSIASTGIYSREEDYDDQPNVCLPSGRTSGDYPVIEWRSGDTYELCYEPFESGPPNPLSMYCKLGGCCQLCVIHYGCGGVPPQYCSYREPFSSYREWPIGEPPSCTSRITSAEPTDLRETEQGKDYYLGSNNDEFLYRNVPDIAFNGDNGLEIGVSDISCPPDFKLFYLNDLNEPQYITPYIIEYPSEGKPYYIISFNPNILAEQLPLEGFTLHVKDTAGNKQEINYKYACKERTAIEYTITEETSIDEIALQTGLTKEEVEIFNIDKEISFIKYSKIDLPYEIIATYGDIKYQNTVCVNGKSITYEENYCSDEIDVIRVESCEKKYIELITEIIRPFIESFKDVNDGIAYWTDEGDLKTLQLDLIDWVKNA